MVEKMPIVRLMGLNIFRGMKKEENLLMEREKEHITIIE